MAVSLLLLLAGGLNAQAEEMDSLEIRGPVYAGTNLEEILAGEGGRLELNARNFPAFYYDIDGDIATESLVVQDGYGTGGYTIGDGDLVYSTFISFAEFAYQGAAWTDEAGNYISNYPLLALFGKPYVPLDPASADKLAPLLLDDDNKYTLRTGEILDLGGGYALEAKQVDVDGGKVWLQFNKDGEYIDDEIIDVSGYTPSQFVWQVDVDGVEGENDVVVLRVHVNQVFQGAVDSIVQLEGLWLIDYEDAISLENDMEYGEFEVNILGDSLEFTNPDSICLEKDSEQELTEGLIFVVADDDEFRFYLMQEYEEPGTYEVRGMVVRNAMDFEWNFSNFPAFYYDMDNDITGEFMAVEGISDRTVPEEGLIYTTELISVAYEYWDWNYFYNGMDWEYTGGYPMEVLFGEPYVSLDPPNADKLAPLILDDDEEYRITTGETLDLGSGYGLEAKQVDTEGDKVWLEFTRDGEFIDDEIIDLSYEEDWDLELDDIEGENDVLVLKVHIGNIYNDGGYDFVEIGALWLIDYEGAFTIENDDEFGVFEVCIEGNTLEFTNDDALTLYADSAIGLAEGMYFRVADSNELRFYPFVERTVPVGESSSGGGSSGESWISWDDPESDGGTRITTAELQEILYYWLNDLPVHSEEE